MRWIFYGDDSNIIRHGTTCTMYTYLIGTGVGKPIY